MTRAVNAARSRGEDLEEIRSPGLGDLCDMKGEEGGSEFCSWDPGLGGWIGDVAPLCLGMLSSDEGKKPNGDLSNKGVNDLTY